MISLLLAAAAPAAKASAAAAAPIKVPISNVPTAGPLQVSPGINYATQTWFQQHAGWLTHTLGALFVIAALALIILLAVQTTKQEGLSGTLGGRVESVYGRPGAEEQLKRITGVTAVAFVVLGTILSLTGI
ncbi:MAG TPA: preprotein translocase subunit SecG [Candidatus Baltobacteraceae bacterium]|nr:preprotein translocase subunit SecG [Candidatus Baltobacteraceae bacterium]